jgi:hypothetical protein
LQYGDEDSIAANITAHYRKLGPVTNSEVYTKNMDKVYKCVNRKGLISADFTVFPFGYK